MTCPTDEDIRNRHVRKKKIDQQKKKLQLLFVQVDITEDSTKLVKGKSNNP